MEEDKKYQHAQYLIGFLNNYCQHHPDSQEVYVSCGKVRIRTYLIILVSVSEFFRKMMSESDFCQDEDGICLIVPDLDPNHLETFLRYLFSRDISAIYCPDDLFALEQVFRTLQINFENFSELADGMTPDSDVQEDFDDPQVQIETYIPPTKQEKSKTSDKRKRPLIISQSKIDRQLTSTSNVNHSSDSDEEHPDVDRVSVEHSTLKDRTIKCRFCDKQYQHIKARNKHLISDHFDECKQSGLIYPCQICGMCFVTSKGLEKHSIRLHDQKKVAASDSKRKKVDDPQARAAILETVTKLSCPFGHHEQVYLPSVKDLKAHVKDAHPDKDKSCWACGLDCASREDLEQHIQSHGTNTREGRSLYNCEQCHAKFLSEYNLVTHKRLVHSVASTLLCRICSKEFKNEKFLKAHEAKHLTGEVLMPGEVLLFKCPVQIGGDGTTCDKSFKLKSNLDRHIRSHQQIKTHMCGECGKSFVDSTRLKEHRWIHSGHRPFQCRYCEKTFRHQNHVRNHEANAHGEDKKFNCTICSKKFVYAYQLRTHLNTHRTPGGVDCRRQILQDNPDYLQVQDEVVDGGEGEGFVQTLYQCSLCHQVLASFQLLQEHCVQHAEIDIQNENLPNGSEDQILIEISDSQAGMGLQGTTLSQDGQQFVVVYDVPANE